MPGHIKLGPGSGPDPDPLPYLVVSQEMRRKDLSKPYDPKRSVWAEDGNGGFIEGLLHAEEGDKIRVLFGHEIKNYKQHQVAPVNPPKFEKCDDMANLTYLNEASVFWNLKSRYQAKLIYTYSGLFCVVINPYKRFPIYTMRVVRMYQGKRRNECPPHLWAVTEAAYRSMLETGKNQSMLITGESGAGKTENTKKVISYLAMVATRGKAAPETKVSLEDQIVATNPILESYGNAKTSRNDNSSRFGKFIRIHFNSRGKLAGCDIKAYLFEKSRITQQQDIERSYHIFYQLLQPAVPELREKCLLSDNIYDYSYVCQGRTKVDSIDDNEELQFTNAAFDIIGFEVDEKWNCFKLTAAVMTMGDLKFKQKGREEQCEPDKPEMANKVATLLGVEAADMMLAFSKPKIKVGTEWVTKGQNVEQATNAVGGIARATYHRTFLWLIEKCNDTLIDKNMKRTCFCAVLDIAGFEIFTFNGYEQLSINFVNEKLQQFFNHHMFVIEQEEYISEGIDWQMVDFGMDLATCITMFEKPMGLWAILEEESLFPKATDKTLEDKLKSTLLGKCPTFVKPQSKTDRNAHFAVMHYAGVVSYNVTNWLEKNKDPVNDSVVEVLKRSTNSLLVYIWRDHPGQPETQDKAKRKGPPSKTVSSVFLVDLNALMATLNSTEPHFVRCIVPNTCKQPGGTDPSLIMHQLTCNGVLEGIRICMRGFPNRITFEDFRKRYGILGRELLASAASDKASVDVVLREALNFSEEKFRIGRSKVFFRAGALGNLEELRDDVLNDLVQKLQGLLLGHQSRKMFELKLNQRNMLVVLQKAFRQFLRHKNWKWFQLIQLTKPLVGEVNMEDFICQLQEQCSEVEEILQEKNDVLSAYELKNQELKSEIDNMKSDLQDKLASVEKFEDEAKCITSSMEKINENISKMNSKLKEEQIMREEIEVSNSSLEVKLEALSMRKENILNHQQDVLDTLLRKDKELNMIQDNLKSLQQVSERMLKENNQSAEKEVDLSDDLKNANEKLEVSQGDLKALEDKKDELIYEFEKEVEHRWKIEKEKAEQESKLKMFKNSVYNMNRQVAELEQSKKRISMEMLKYQEKLAAEETAAGHLQICLKDLKSNCSKVEHDLEAEKQRKLNAEREIMGLASQNEAMSSELERKLSEVEDQMVLKHQLDMALDETKKEQQDMQSRWENSIQKQRMKHQEALNDLGKQIESIRCAKFKLEQDLTLLQSRLEETQACLQAEQGEKILANKHFSTLKEKLNSGNKRINDAQVTLSYMDNELGKLTKSNSSHHENLECMRNNISLLEAEKKLLKEELQKAKETCDNLAAERDFLHAKVRALECETNEIGLILLETQAATEEMSFHLERSNEEADNHRLRFEKLLKEDINNLEAAKAKLQASLLDAENKMEILSKKLVTGEAKCLEVERSVEEWRHKTEKEKYFLNKAEKECKHMEREISNWEGRCNNLAQQLQVSQENCRSAAAEMFTLKNDIDDMDNKLLSLVAENKKLAGEIVDCAEKMKDNERKISQTEKIIRTQEHEKSYLTDTLQEINCSLEQEKEKLKQLESNISQVKDETDRRLTEKEAAFIRAKAEHDKLVLGLQKELEATAKQKVELAADKLKLESERKEVTALVHEAADKQVEAKRRLADTLKQVEAAKRTLAKEEEGRSKASSDLTDQERRLRSMVHDIEEMKCRLEQTDRVRRELEQELMDTQETLANHNREHDGLIRDKKTLLANINNLKIEKDEVNDDESGLNARIKQLMIEAASLVEELREAQDNSAKLCQEIQDEERKVRELQVRCDEEETEAIRSGDKVIRKLREDVRSMEVEVEEERRRLITANNNLRKARRDITELEIKGQEDGKAEDRLKTHVERLHAQVVNYKRQLEEAEEIATINLSKWQRVVKELQQRTNNGDLL